MARTYDSNVRFLAIWAAALTVCPWPVRDPYRADADDCCLTYSGHAGVKGRVGS